MSDNPVRRIVGNVVHVTPDEFANMQTIIANAHFDGRNADGAAFRALRSVLSTSAVQSRLYRETEIVVYYGEIIPDDEAYHMRNHPRRPPYQLRRGHGAP